ncbi:MAG TPA: hypothetical protein VMW46_07365 [Candidatus Desulfaltia sp.]|nr:hypothetical protein [Candidatus Desulfaltia sp.]
MQYLFAALIVSLATNVILAVLHYREKKEIFNRFMAGDYRTYQYFKKEFPVEVEDKKEKLEAEREKEPTELELELKKRGVEY